MCPCVCPTLPVCSSHAAFCPALLLPCLPAAAVLLPACVPFLLYLTPTSHYHPPAPPTVMPDLLIPNRMDMPDLPVTPLIPSYLVVLKCAFPPPLLEEEASSACATSSPALPCLTCLAQQFHLPPVAVCHHPHHPTSLPDISSFGASSLPLPLATCACHSPPLYPLHSTPMFFVGAYRHAPYPLCRGEHSLGPQGDFCHTVTYNPTTTLCLPVPIPDYLFPTTH